MMTSHRVIQGDCLEGLKTLESGSVNCCVTSPPYFGLRDYGVDGQIGLEDSPDEYIGKMVDVFREVRRVLRKDGTLWLNLGDGYSGRRQSPGQTDSRRRDNAVIPRNDILRNGYKPKDMIGIPWRVAFALQADGWYLRQDIIWAKPNPMPESVTDRCTKSHEYIFLFAKSERYYYDAEAIKEKCTCSEPFRFVDGGKDKQRGHGRRHAGFNGRYAEKIARDGAPEKRNRRSVWTVPTKPYKEAHFATYPPNLIRPCILAGCPYGGTVLDPFGGSGTTAAVAKHEGRSSILIELNPAYIKFIERRIRMAQEKIDLFRGVA